MKKYRLFILIGALLLVAAVAIWYFLRDRDEDRISPIVEVRSLHERLLAEVRSRSGREFSALTEPEKIAALTAIARSGSRDISPAAVRLLGEFSGTAAGAAAIVSCLEDSVYAVAAEALALIGRDRMTGASGAVRKKIASLASMPDAAVPFADVEYIAGTGRLKEGDLVFDFAEKQSTAQPIDDPRASEINLFLPRGAEYYFSFPNFDNRWEDFQNSAFMTAFRKQPAYEDLPGFGPLEEMYTFKSLIDRKLGSFSRFFTPEKMFRDDLKFARFPEGRLFVTFKGKNAELAEALAGILPAAGRERYRIARRQVQGCPVTEIGIRGGRRICFSTAGDYFLVADNPALIERSLVTFYATREQSLGAFPPFQQAYKQLDLRDRNTFCFLFADPSRALGFDGGAARSRYLLKRARNVLASLGGAQLRSDDTPVAAERMSIARAIPASHFACIVADDADPRLFWEYLRRNRATSATAIDSLERGSGVRLEGEIVGKLERGMFLSYEGIRYGADHESNVSVLKSVLGVSSPRAAELTAPVARLFRFLFRNAPVETTYAGWKIQVCTSPNPPEAASGAAAAAQGEDLLSPCFAVVDRGILFSLNASLLKEHLDAYRGAAPSAFPNGFTGEKVSEKILIRTAPLLRNAYSFLARYARRTTRFTDREIRDRIQPFFALLESNLSVHGWFKEYDGIYHGQITLDMK